ncbi:MAG: peptidoglycan editing factor PgeF [Acidobacteria bacterium]|nr:peptidoglycan editing factor PgeF [Acidobacteriota bacterium]
MSALRSQLLSEFDWVGHGFGTRDDGYWTPQARTAALHQVHGAGVVRVDAPGHHGDGDALIAQAVNLWLEIRTADCVPLLLVDPVRRAVAAVHAGWRGTATWIAGLTVDAMRREFHSEPGELYAAIGPCIGSCCFEVGDEVAAQFPGYTINNYTRPHVDLVSANVSQLTAAGVRSERIDSLGLCTVCEPARFHSFRRDRGDGRMVAAVAIHC